MGEKSKIGWTDYTASPWFGCTEVSPGCTHCYARELTLQKGWAGWGDNSPRVRSKGFWTNAYKWDRKAAPLPAAFSEAPHVRPRIFTSLMDWLDEKVPIEWLGDFLKVVHDCQNLDWLLLTKRSSGLQRVRDALDAMKECSGDFETWIHQWCDGFPPQNVWYGMTMEDQIRFDERIVDLVQTPAKVRWISFEPLIGPIDMKQCSDCGVSPRQEEDGRCAVLDSYCPRQINWAVIGGESGKERRDCGIRAIEDLVQQCQLLRIPTYVKQDTAPRSGAQGRISDEVWQLKQFPV